MNRIGAASSGTLCRGDVEPGTKSSRNSSAAARPATLAPVSKSSRASLGPSEDSDQPRLRRARIHAVGVTTGTGSPSSSAGALVDSHRLEVESIALGPNAYRFTWWLPTAVACRVFGLTERGFIVPILVFDVLGIVTVYLLATNLWGRAAAVAAALLLVVLPLDVAWSTMLTMDIVLSVFSALCILAVLRATDRDGAPPRERALAWPVAGLCLWLAYHTKISALLLVPALGAIAWIRRRALDRTVLYFVATTIGLFSATVLGPWILAGDPLAPYHTELTWQGLTGDDAVRSHRFTS